MPPDHPPVPATPEQAHEENLRILRLMREEPAWALDRIRRAAELEALASSQPLPDREQAVETLAVRYFNRSRWSPSPDSLDELRWFNRAAPDLREQYREQARDDLAALWPPEQTEEP